jgi:hypothetical protein
MIHKNDEFLHEFKNKKDWVESFHINFVSKKNKVLGAADVNFLFSKKQIETYWILIINNKKYENTNLIKFNGKLNSKKIGNNKFEYSIVSPLEKFKLEFKDEQINANINIAALCPIYDFPDNIVDNEINDQQIITHKTWNKYQQRCKISGNILVKAGDGKGKKVNFDCFGQREHVWGINQLNNVSIQSTLNVQFRDMAMILTYSEKKAISESNGFISKRSGNIPIINVECESLTTNKSKDNLLSSEFSYKDAQDDVDLLVARSLFSIPMPLPASKRKKFFRFRNFSEFTVIGTNKKGYGVEDIYISAQMLKLLQGSDEKK